MRVLDRTIATRITKRMLALVASLLVATIVWADIAPSQETSQPLATFEATHLNGKTTPFSPKREGLADVFIFILGDCPISNRYQPTIRRLAKEFQAVGIRFHLVHADPETTVEAARQHAREYQIESPIYLDPGHQLVTHLGATVSPEVVVINAENQKVYQGRIDNLYFKLGRKRTQVTQHDLKDALRALRSGQTIPNARTQAIGCYIPELEP